MELRLTVRIAVWRRQSHDQKDEVVAVDMEIAIDVVVVAVDTTGIVAHHGEDIEIGVHHDIETEAHPDAATGSFIVKHFYAAQSNKNLGRQIITPTRALHL